MDLVLHPITKVHTQKFLDKPSHALLILGPVGSGKGTLAAFMASQLLNVKKPNEHPYFRRIVPEKASISINDIRGLQEFTRLKTPGTSPVRRLIIIEAADTMTKEAQNALLKVLEEPPADTVLIMTASQPHGLLPTVISRAQRLAVRVPSQTSLSTYFQAQGHSKAAIDKAYYMSEGQVGLMSAILAGDDSHALVMAIATAKELLSVPLFERLAQADELSKQKELLPGILQGLQRVAHAALTGAVQTGRNREANIWQTSLKRIIDAQAALVQSANPKLLLTELFLNIWFIGLPHFSTASDPTWLAINFHLSLNVAKATFLKIWKFITQSAKPCYLHKSMEVLYTSTVCFNYCLYLFLAR